MTNKDLDLILSRAIDINKRYNTTLNNWGLTTSRQRLYFFTQCGAESMLKSQRESLYYSTVNNARNTFYTPFKSKSDSFVQTYLKNSVKMANYVYANRGGNGNEASGDGYKYRGGGILQNTFYDGYKLLEKEMKVPFTKNPDLILEEPNAVVSACIFWKRNNINKVITSDDLKSLDYTSDLVNKGKVTSAYGDTNGFKERLEVFNKLKTHFK